MTAALPPLPDRALLADLCREAAAREQVQPYLVEKDFYLTRLLWALGAELQTGLLLKGGTLLAKVDLGFFRMSEDADFVIAEPPSRNKGTNMRRINQLQRTLAAIEVAVGALRRYPGGEPYDKGAHRRWDLDYPSEFGDHSIQLEVSLRPVIQGPRRVRLRMLLTDPLLGGYEEAHCWALDADEARAEKVRAAFTREAIRDFYDLDRLADRGFDLSSDAFIALVDAKLKEVDAPPFAEQPRPFGMTPARRAKLERGMGNELQAVLRGNAPPFDLDRMLARFTALWTPTHQP